MDALRRVVATIQQYLGKMSLSQRLLMVSLAVIAAMSLFLVAQYAAKPSSRPLAGIEAAEYGRAASILNASGIRAEVRDDGLYVAANQQIAAIAAIQQDPSVAADAKIMFDNLVEKQDWRMSREQNRQQFFFAKQNELSRVISRFRGVSSAMVILDVPEQGGLGRTTREPSASVTVTMASGAMPQKSVDAVASLVSGAVAGLSVDRVEVIDGWDQRKRRVAAEDDFAATTYIEHRSLVERTVRSKIEAHLSYIPGVMVAVTADVDVSRVSQSTKRHLPLNDGTISIPRRDSSTSLTENGASNAAEPGVRSMQGASINEASSSTALVEQSEADTEFDNAIGTEVREVVDPRGAPTFVAVTVNVPEGFVRELIDRDSRASGDANAAADPAAAGGAAAAAGAGQTLAERFELLRADIERTIRPHIKTRDASGVLTEGDINIAMVPVDMPGMGAAIQSAGFLGMFAGSGGAGGAFGEGGPLNTVL
ncbi:MAG: hypothetical protein AAF235_05180, partial [Planctomycetota bacterium]